MNDDDRQDSFRDPVKLKQAARIFRAALARTEREGVEAPNCEPHDEPR
jgi:hypothetical protein